MKYVGLTAVFGEVLEVPIADFMPPLLAECTDSSSFTLLLPLYKLDCWLADGYDRVLTLVCSRNSSERYHASVY